MDSIARIEIAGRTCYKSEDKIGCTQPEMPDGWCRKWNPNSVTTCADTNCSEHSSNKFARMLIKKGHEAMIEHGSASVKFITNRGVSHEIVRHRLPSYGQESTRYVNYGGEDMAFIRPVWCDDSILGTFDIATRPGHPDDATNTWCNTMANLESEYNRLLLEGWRPEQAREVLPNSLKTEIVVTANFREWRHIFKLRAIGTTGKPHPQMQALMLPVLEEFAERCPAVFGGLLPSTQGGES